MNTQKIWTPILVDRFADNGDHGHWELIEPEDGVVVWSSDPEESAARGNKVASSLPSLPSDEDIKTACVDFHVAQPKTFSNTFIAYIEGAKEVRSQLKSAK